MRFDRFICFSAIAIIGFVLSIQLGKSSPEPVVDRSKFIVQLKRGDTLIDEFKSFDVPTRSGQYYRFETQNGGFVFLPIKDGYTVDWSQR